MAAQEEIHLPSPAKKSKLEEEFTDGEKPQQLVERHWVKVEQSKHVKESPQDQRLLKVMQWNMLADGKCTYLYLLSMLCMRHTFHGDTSHVHNSPDPFSGCKRGLGMNETTKVWWQSLKKFLGLNSSRHFYL